MAKRSLGMSILVWTGRVALGLVGLVVLAFAIGAGWEAHERSKARHDFPMVGRLVDIGGGRHIHIDCRGQGSPTVVLENGLDANGTYSWSAVQDQIAQTTRVCAYDRAGMVWSDPKPGVHDADGIADDLHAALAAAGEKAPLVLVGHSLGGPYIMDYTRKFPDQVAGLVFVDASHPDQIKRFREARIPGTESTSLSPVLIILKDLSWSGVTRILLNSQEENQPNATAQANAAMRAFGPRGMPAAVDEAEAMLATDAEAGKLRELGDRPLVVLTATKAPSAAMLKSAGLKPADYDRLQTVWLALHNDEASWSTRSRHQIVPDSTHYIQFGRPDIVIAAVKEVVGEVRRK
jgi:pimeloyl-ACP methyl ester carboxylesterase